MEVLLSAEGLIALATLAALEIVLGIDNIIFISILTSKLPPEKQPSGRVIGLGLAMLMRILLLFSLSWIMRLTEPLFAVLGAEISGRDIIMLLGGLFLLGKATIEIHDQIEGHEEKSTTPKKVSYGSILVQIILLDIIFSLDSVITAVGMVDELVIMVTAVVIAVIIMMFFVGPVSSFVEKNPTVKMLALSFLLLIGVTLVADGLGFHIPKGYIYFAIAFSVFTEMLNLKVRKHRALLRTA